jgi:hypothetical protein
MTGLYYGFWDYWELRHKVTFDGPNKLILINEGVTDLDAQTELYSDWKEWTLLENNLKYLSAFNTVGGEPTVAGQRLDVTYFLINGWKLKPYPGSYDLNIVGNIFDVDGGSIKVASDINPEIDNNISINLNTSVIVRQVDSGTSTSGSGLTVAENAALFNIEDRVIIIESLLQAPISASLVGSQLIQLTNIESLATSQSLQITSLVETNTTQSLQLTSLVQTNYSQSLQLSELQNKLFEVWQLHGLDITFPLTVNQTSRTFGDVDQTISTTGTGSSQETIISRN